MTKRLKYQSGDFFKIKFINSFSYGRVLSSPLMAFYDKTYTEDQPLDVICKANIAFKIWINDEAIVSGRWPIIGHIHLDVSLLSIPKFFKQDPISRKLYTYENGIESPASIDECMGLEKAAVWAPKHVEERLESFFLGKKSKYMLMVNFIKP
ncbi:Imm26 family immunity protein [Methylobacterium sp. Leaf100]|uniref:Imm26 family immunity protein n=1 Tax=Methylobacterium sp. Leaf100 TaxID=1736252 RepID=UPI0009EA8671|nr:Imm26 family immunity protein [Methylobacterium sp. Leaf100]